MAVAGITKEVIEIPEGVQANVQDRTVTVKGPKGEQSRTFPVSRIILAKEGNAITLTAELPRRKDSALLGTFRGHIQNMLVGVSNGFVYKMKIVYSHFPVKAAAKEGYFQIDNFLGEKHPRIAQIMGDTKVTVKGDEVILEGSNKEHVGQSAANIEQATRIKGYDLRVFQDGIYIVSKGGVAE
ncbi:MAG: 50S ribosomal protein L6 [Candidatus Proteinoplasmatales archaeon SG8-5]|nr:MAG: 50S ribosomal protein L6 [Candidatus Proteinoplasmatales archaeon SG8-5]